MVAWRGLVTVVVALLWAATTLSTGQPNGSGASSTDARCAPPSAVASPTVRTVALADTEGEDGDTAAIDALWLESSSPVRLAVVGASAGRSSWSSFAASGGLAGRPRGPPSLA